MNKLIGNLTGMTGRISRQEWWIGVVVLVVIAVVLNFILGMIMGGAMPSVEQLADPAYVSAYLQRMAWQSFIIGLLVAYPYIALSVKRRHDRDNNGLDAIGLIVLSLLWSLVQALGLIQSTSGVATVIGFVFGIYAVYLLVQLGFLKGTTGSNSYGPDPLLG
ncbi:MAG TPA: DUF805 domain-containing protein [Devosia sp.]|jgi:uncharacterized membrane protein YhaH (DUF805 family)|nr:DUF805 domain-containing protein [Devosia sp.]